MSKHTPGPWTENACEVQASDGSPICEMLSRSEDTDKWGHHHADANSRLICAAPDLLAAMEDVVASAQANCSGSLANAIDAGQEAIAKAKGGEG
jgi:hypothetical protein